MTMATRTDSPKTHGRASERTRGRPVLPEVLERPAVERLCREGILSASSEVPDVSAVRQADGAGLALLWLLARRAGTAPAFGEGVALEGLDETLRGRLEAYAAALRGASAPAASQPSQNPISALGQATCDTLAGWGAAIAYLGEVLWSAVHLFSGRFRWGDCRLAFLRCGVQAVPVMMLIGFLMGLILAFQSAIPLKMFGGEGFVGGLVGIALVRELGLIVAAILRAGRTGSAFAAELGTMKVNEEIEALETMGLSPVRFLVLPRVLAGTLALPTLSLLATLAGLLGGWLVMGVLGFSAHYYLDQLQAFVHVKDILGSVCKAFVFGFAVSATGCWFGLRAGRDAGAVGTATTAAVVVGIVLLAVLEGIFSVVFYAMGW